MRHRSYRQTRPDETCDQSLKAKPTEAVVLHAHSPDWVDWLAPGERQPKSSVAAHGFEQLDARSRKFEIVFRLARGRDLDPTLGSTVRAFLHDREIERFA